MNIEVRAWCEEDALSLHHLSMHPFFSKERLLQYFYPDTFLNAMSMIYFYHSADPQRFLFRAIEMDGKLVGAISAQKKTDAACELSYWLGVEYWHKGIMKKAVESMCKQVFELLPVLCIYAIVEEKNIASQAILEHQGFQKEQVEHMLVYRKFK